MRRAAKAALRSSIYDRPMQQHHDLSTLRSGERVISEHVANVRSVSFGFWIGTGSRDETDSRAGVSHFIEHLLFKGTGSHSAQEIAEIFDGLGGELNAATSRETTLVYARVPDDRLEPALDVMAGMVYDPAFEDNDPGRDGVLEGIAMVGDKPHGPAARDGRAHSTRPQAVRARAAARLPLPAEGDRAVPRLSRRAGDLAPRRAPRRRLAARLDPRRLRIVPAVPGDPGEARDGVLRVQLRLPVL